MCESPTQQNWTWSLNFQLLLWVYQPTSLHYFLLKGDLGSSVHGQGHGVWSRLCCGSCGDSVIAPAPLIPIHFSSLITGSVCSPALSPVGAAVRWDKHWVQSGRNVLSCQFSGAERWWWGSLGIHEGKQFVKTTHRFTDVGGKILYNEKKIHNQMASASQTCRWKLQGKSQHFLCD